MTPQNNERSKSHNSIVLINLYPQRPISLMPKKEGIFQKRIVHQYAYLNY